jgi:hypothetical protein
MFLALGPRCIGIFTRFGHYTDVEQPTDVPVSSSIALIISTYPRDNLAPQGSAETGERS